jgi:hypothetical protein
MKVTEHKTPRQQQAFWLTWFARDAGFPAAVLVGPYTYSGV